jgi:hypothetical protein
MISLGLKGQQYNLTAVHAGGPGDTLQPETILFTEWIENWA